MRVGEPGGGWQVGRQHRLKVDGAREEARRQQRGEVGLRVDRRAVERVDAIARVEYAATAGCSVSDGGRRALELRTRTTPDRLSDGTSAQRR